MTQAMHDHLPAEGLWLAYYGDDFTGSTDVLDAFMQVHEDFKAIAASYTDEE